MNTTITISVEMKKKLAMLKLKRDFPNWEDFMQNMYKNYIISIKKGKLM